jgi:hypothetical protein
MFFQLNSEILITMQVTKMTIVASVALSCTALFTLAAPHPASSVGRGESSGDPKRTTPALESWTSKRPDGHAPAGVMGDHLHHAGEWMVGYHFMFNHAEGLREGTSTRSNAEVLRDGFDSVPLEMDMSMHMLEVMYAPTDWLTVMVMAQYVEMEMAMWHGHTEHHGHEGKEEHGHSHEKPGAGNGRMEHSTSGWGDTTVTGLFKLFEFDRQIIHAGLGLSLPTGSVDETMHGKFTHYGMQLGSGTYDFKPSLTYLGQADRFSWGSQVSGVIRLEDENESGFRFGNILEATAWAAVKITSIVSVSGRLLYRYEGDIKGHYNGPHNHSSPPDFQENYGGEWLNAGVGVNLYAPSGWLKGHRLAVEALFPVWQDLNGVQLEQDYSLVATWQWAF